MFGRQFKNAKKIAITRAQIKFLTACTHLHLIPSGLQSKPRFHTRKSDQMEREFGKKRLREELNHLHARLFTLKLQQEFSPPEIPQDIKQDITEYQNQIYHQHSETLKQQLDTLCQLSPRIQPQPTQYKLDSVLDLTTRRLTETEKRVLSLGPKFRPSLPHIPFDEYIIATESFIKSNKLDPEEATKLRLTVQNKLTKIQQKSIYRPPKCNLNAQDWAAIKSLKNDQTIIIIPADKGNKTIVMDRQSYLSKLKERIQTHTILPEDPTPQYTNKINNAISIITKTKPPPNPKRDKSKQLILARANLNSFKSHDLHPPFLKGQLKAHKPDHPLREISDASLSPGHKLAKTLYQVFKLYVGNTKTYIRNADEFLSLLKTPRFNKPGIFVSFDADKLYPSILIPEALHILKHKLQYDKSLHTKTDLTREELLKLTILCISEPYFSCEHGIYQQSEGAPMGGPLSSLLADLVLENKIEAKINQHPIWKSKCDWIRKADDTFMTWTGSLQELEEFHSYLNTLHPTIQWTKEIESDNKIPFLDVLIFHNNNQIRTSVYRKPSASDRYTHYTSAQAWKEKAATIKSLYGEQLNTAQHHNS